MPIRARYILPLWLLLVFSACTPKRSEPPIPLDSLENILLDVHLAESYSIGLGDSAHRQDKNRDTLAFFYRSVLAHHQIDLQRFLSAMDWLKEHPDAADSLYKRMTERIGTLKAEKGIADLPEADGPAKATNEENPPADTDNRDGHDKDMDKSKTIQDLPPEQQEQETPKNR